MAIGKKRRFSDVSDLETDPVCTLDPTFRQGRVTQLMGLVGTPLIPATALIIFCAYKMAVSTRNVQLSKSIISDLDETTNMWKMFLLLLEEMDGVVSLIAANGTVILGELHELYLPTDASLQNLKPWLESINSNLISSLNEHRKIHSDLRNASMLEEVMFYTGQVTEIKDGLFTELNKGNWEKVWPVLVSFQHLMNGLLQFGLERAFGMVSFIQGYLSIEEFRQYVGAYELGNYHMEMAMEYSSIVEDEYYHQFTANKYLSEWINTTRVEILNNKQSGVNLFASLVWYRKATSLLNVIRNIERELGDVTQNIIRDTLVLEVEIISINIIIIFVVAFLILPFLGAISYKTVSSLYLYSQTTEKRNFELKKEKRKTESLLNEMLPRAVAYRMRKGEEIEAETFESVTIFFSDVTDFTEISMVSDPIDIVLFLNEFYQLIDTHVGRYDVYKVETISASYMVVSGLPSRNGHRHSIEIAKFSLDLMKLTEEFKIPHLPERILQLRVGCHTGRHSNKTH